MAVGQLLDEQYEVLSLIKEGTNSHVYKAKERLTGLLCTAKVFKTGQGKDALVRFQQEGGTIRKLDHPRILRFQTFGAAESGEPYVILDHAEGESLEDLLGREGLLPVPKALDLFEQICDALGFAHHSGLIHRNLKPSKIVVTANSTDTIEVVVFDFGIAGILRSDYNQISNLTKPGATGYSPDYMSPEQCMARQIDGRADIYALGCIMYRVLTGCKPIQAKNAIEVLAKHINEPPRNFKQANPANSVSRELEKIVFRCLEKNPEDRFASVSELRRALENFQERGTAGHAVSHVSIPGAKPEPALKTSDNKAKEAVKPQPPAAKSVEISTPPPPPTPASVQPSSESSLQGHLPEATAPEPVAGPQESKEANPKMRRPKPVAGASHGVPSSNKLGPILVIALLLGGLAIAAGMSFKPSRDPSTTTGTDGTSSTSVATATDTLTNTSAVMSAASDLVNLSEGRFCEVVFPRLPQSVKGLIEKEDSLDSMEQSGGEDWVMAQKIKPALAQVTSGSIEDVFARSRLADVLLINEFNAEADALYETSLTAQKSFGMKPQWLADRTRAGAVAAGLTYGRTDLAIEELMAVCQEQLRKPNDAAFKEVVAQLQSQAKGVSEVLSSTGVADSVLEEHLRTILASADSVQSRNFELKTFTLWYLLMVNLNKKDSDKSVRRLLDQFESLTEPVTKSHTAVGYLLFLASQKARDAGVVNLARRIDELAVKRLQFYDSLDPLFMAYSRWYPTGLPGLTVRSEAPASAASGDSAADSRTSTSTQP